MPVKKNNIKLYVFKIEMITVGLHIHLFELHRQFADSKAIHVERVQIRHHTVCKLTNPRVLND